jgi:hypothetical protein
MPKGTAVEKRLLQLAGEYAVAAQMALHGWHASLTVGNFPEIDIVAYKPETGKRVTVQVKTARQLEWFVGNYKREGERWEIFHFPDRADVHVFVHLTSNDINAAEFYVVGSTHLKQLCEKLLEKIPLKDTLKKRLLIVGKDSPDHKHAPEVWEEIVKRKNRWDLLERVAR